MGTAIALFLSISVLPQFAFTQAAEPAGLQTAGGFVASGDRYFAKGDYRSAAVQYQNAILLDNKFEPGHAKLGFTFLKLANWNPAYRELTLATAENPDDLKAQLALADMLTHARQFHRALDIVNTALAKDPQNVQARMLRISIKRAIEMEKADGDGVAK